MYMYMYMYIYAHTHDIHMHVHPFVAVQGRQVSCEGSIRNRRVAGG